MNILFIIGNGFDINLGLKTQYSNFYKYWLNQHSDIETIRELKERIGAEEQNWSDLELALGSYTEKLKSTDEFLEIFADLQDSLADYLDSVDSLFDEDEFDSKQLQIDLSQPYRQLYPVDQIRIEDFSSKVVLATKSSSTNIHIISFNYTKTFEKLTKYNGRSLVLNNSNRPVVLNSIEHVHGLTNDRMILGVNDTSQVSNRSFHTDEDVLNSLIKQNSYRAHRFTTQETCLGRIVHANLICVFGSSLGDTDKYWWEQVGNRLKNEHCILIIFQKGESVSPRRPQYGLNLENKVRNYFLDKTLLSKEDKEKVRSKIYVRINSKLFDLKVE